VMERPEIIPICHNLMPNIAQLISKARGEAEPPSCLNNLQEMHGPSPGKKSPLDDLGCFFLVERGWHTEPNQVNRSRIVGFGMTRVPMQRPSKTHSQSVTNQATVNNS
jgi:hypothetical protein